MSPRTLLIVVTLCCWPAVGFPRAGWCQVSPVLAGLLKQSPEKLALTAKTEGDAVRGAQVFFQPLLACASCHDTGDPAGTNLRRVGPKLSGTGLEVTPARPTLSDVDLVQAILRPSQTIAKGFETTQVLLDDGRVLTGILISQTDSKLELKDASSGQVLTLNPQEVEAVKQNPLSIMPDGVAGQLASRAQFLDLVRYLMEIRDGGDARAAQLRPSTIPQATPLPEYEAHVDHAGMIADLDEAAFKRGAQIYSRSCANCHGTLEQEGSLPTSLRFATGRFKNGFHPFAMYQTLTHGFGLMTPQPWLVPQQKYDVIHYIRQSFLQPHNPSQYARVDRDYLAGLPTGDTRGPEPSRAEPWQQMDYGPNLMGTFEVGSDGSNIAYKGHALRLDEGPGGVALGRHFILYEHDTLRVAGAWSGEGFIDFRGINFDGAHQKHPRIVGDVLFANRSGPGWANPQNGSFDEVRQPGRDGRFYGPLPRTWLDYLGTYVRGPQTIVHYRVGQVEIHELPAVSQGELSSSAAESPTAESPTAESPTAESPTAGSPTTNLPTSNLSTSDSMSDAVPSAEAVVFERHLLLGPASHELIMRVADRPGCEHRQLVRQGDFMCLLSAATPDLPGLVLAVAGEVQGVEWELTEAEVRLRIPAADRGRRLTLLVQAAGTQPWSESRARLLTPRAQRAVEMHDPRPRVVAASTSVQRWPESVTSQVTLGDETRGLAVDTIHTPFANPWNCRMRLTGLDFETNRDAAVVTDWDGNVWRVTGLHSSSLVWQRIASGLFQPLGIKIRDGETFVCCRDQICRLRDLDGDGETDYYESFNHDHIITEHFHEFAMGLQCDVDGNFYYAKSARHALPAVVPHHGTLLKVSADGRTTEILAKGFRAANGVCLNEDGTFFVTDQEGHWNPKNRINWVKPGEFYGNMFGYHDVTDASDQAMTQPLCWITNAFDRSPAELLWVSSDRWGPLKGSLLNMSYGYGKLYVVPHELKGGQLQGGMCELPINPLPTGIMRGRFHPIDGALYLVGMYAWAGNQTDNGGFYRVRYTGQPLVVPLTLRCKGTTVRIGLSDEIDPASVAADSFAISSWDLHRSAKYGSEHLNTRQLHVARAAWDAAQRELILDVPELSPTWCMEIIMDLRTPDGTPIHRVIHNTIHSTARN